MLSFFKDQVTRILCYELANFHVAPHSHLRSRELKLCGKVLPALQKRIA
jgi:hypothetical protein